MLRARCKYNGIYWIFILYITIGIVYAKKHKGCDKDDLQCQEKLTSTSSMITSSSFSSIEPSHTYIETLSDFHEAKVLNPKFNPDKPNTLKPEQEVSTFQDLGSSNEGMPTGTANDDTQPLSALSNVETGILSACGILVVAGIAVGIFVWKNTTHKRNLRQNHEFPISDIENNNNGDGDISFTHNESIHFDGINLKKQDVKLPSIVYDQHNFFSNWQRRNGSHQDQDNLQYEPKQKSPITRVISEKAPATILSDLKFQIPTFKRALFSSEEEPKIIKKSNKIRINMEEYDSGEEILGSPNKLKDEDSIITASHLRNSDYGPMFASSPQIQTNQLIPSALDPTYDPTALTYPLQKFLRDTPKSIENPSIMPISIHLNSEDDDDDENDEIEIKKELNGSLSHQLTKLLEPDQHTMIEIDLEGKNKNSALSNPQKTYLELEEHKSIYEQEKEPTNVFNEDYNQEYFNKYGQLFMSSLDLPDDQYIPLRNASGPELISRAQVLADPIRRLGEDEIALWEQSCIKKELKRISLETWDEQTLKK